MYTGKIISRIYGMKRGWCFTPKDFLDLTSPTAIWQTLSRLEKKGTIRRLLRGVYDYPEKNTFLQGYASPDPDRVARAIARSKSWNIVPDGNTALMLIGLSTQIPAEWGYLTDGPDSRYDLGNQRIIFRKQPAKDAAGLSKDSAILVQAIKSLGKDVMETETLRKLGEYLPPGNWEKTFKECRYVTAWILEILKKAAETSRFDGDRQ